MTNATPPSRMQLAAKRPVQNRRAAEAVTIHPVVNSRFVASSQEMEIQEEYVERSISDSGSRNPSTQRRRHVATSSQYRARGDNAQRDPSRSKSGGGRSRR